MNKPNSWADVPENLRDPERFELAAPQAQKLYDQLDAVVNSQACCVQHPLQALSGIITQTFLSACESAGVPLNSARVDRLIDHARTTVLNLYETGLHPIEAILVLALAIQLASVDSPSCEGDEDNAPDP